VVTFLLSSIVDATRLNFLMWTRGGFTIVHKRLEVGTFTMVERSRSAATHIELGAHELSMLLEGIDASRARIAPR
jgi:transposase